MDCGGIVLCGGQSSRMGLPKATLPFGSEVMLARVVRLLGEVVEPIVVVAADDQSLPVLPERVTIARDRRPARGPLGGLAAGRGSRGSQTDAVFVTSCDVPLLAPAFVRRMIELLGAHQIAVPSEGRFHHPLAAVYRTGVLPVVEELLADDALRPAFLFERVDTRLVPVSELRDVDPDLRTLANLNQPQDYLAALAAVGFEAPPEVLTKLVEGKRP